MGQGVYRDETTFLSSPFCMRGSSMARRPGLHQGNKVRNYVRNYVKTSVKIDQLLSLALPEYFKLQSEYACYSE